MLAGSAGTGGASEACETGDMVPFARPGDGLRKVLSVIDPLLFCRCSPGRGVPPLLGAALPLDDADPRRDIRFVCMLPTSSGDVVCDRRAAAAAAEDREGVDGALWKKAEVAASAALDEVLRSTGCVTIALGQLLAVRCDPVVSPPTGLAELPLRRENMLGILSSA